jgi:hypothetical protein
MRTPALAAIALLIATTLTAPVAAQSEPKQAPPKPVVDEVFSIPAGEFARVMLAGGSAYRVEIGSEGLRLQVRPLQSGVQDPLVQQLLPGESSSGTVLYTVTARADGMYEFRSAGGDAGRATRVRVTLVPEKVK